MSESNQSAATDGMEAVPGSMSCDEAEPLSNEDIDKGDADADDIDDGSPVERSLKGFGNAQQRNFHMRKMLMKRWTGSLMRRKKGMSSKEKKKKQRLPRSISSGLLKSSF